MQVLNGKGKDAPFVVVSVEITHLKGVKQVGTKPTTLFIRVRMGKLGFVLHSQRGIQT